MFIMQFSAFVSKIKCWHGSGVFLLLRNDRRTSLGERAEQKTSAPDRDANLNLRPLTMDDLDDWLKFVMDEDSCKYLENYAPDHEDARDWLEKSKVKRFAQPGGYLALGIEQKADARIVGHVSISLSDPEEHRQGSFNILISPAYCCRGYGTEVLAGIFAFGFDGIGLHDIRCRLDGRNVAARRMAEKAGMKLEGEFCEERRVKGAWQSGVYYAILSSWWASKNVKRPA